MRRICPASDAAGLADSSTASLSSALFAVATLMVVGDIFARQRRIFGSVLNPDTRLFDWYIITSATLLAVALSLRSVGFLPRLGFAPYVACLLFFMFGAIQVFVRIVFFASYSDGENE